MDQPQLVPPGVGEQRWFQTTGPLPEGWYWWNCQISDDAGFTGCTQVINVNHLGDIVDVHPVDSYGIEWRQFTHKDYSGWWYGPLPFPTMEGVTETNNERD